MPKISPFFDQVYDLEKAADTQDLYRHWAKTYDEDVQAHGYITPRRTAEAMAGAVSDLAAPLLDIGCGTGLSGVALRRAGFEIIDGTDFSKEMINAARAKNVYRALMAGDFSDPATIKPSQYTNFAAIGVFSPGHGMPELIDQVVSAMRQGGCFGFSLNEHALKDPGYERTIGVAVQSGIAELVFDQLGDHLPGLGSKSKIYVLRKLQ